MLKFIMGFICKIISRFGIIIYKTEWEELKNDIEREIYFSKSEVIPLALKISLVAGEDHRFFYHKGFDIISFFRAFIKTMFFRKIEGGSTIEQQLVRTITGDRRMSLKRKIKEIFLATMLERIINKREIIDIYLINAYFGWRMSGIHEASKKLNFKLKNLTLLQACLIIARLKYPESKYSSKEELKKINNRAVFIYEKLKKIQKGGSEFIMPFEVKKIEKDLKDQFLSATILKSALPKLDSSGRQAVARQWISEGIPYFCKDIPMIYERIREWLSLRLEIHPKKIVVLGSAKTGISFDTDHFGRTFESNNSDLDLAIVSEHFFKKYVEDFKSWKRNYKNCNIKPKNDFEKRMWDYNIEGIPKYQIPNGFIDSNKVPARDLYETAQTTLNILSELTIQVNETDGILNISKTTLRIYKNWRAFMAQRDRNLKEISEKIETDQINYYIASS